MLKIQSFSTINVVDEKKDSLRKKVIEELDKAKAATENVLNTIDREVDQQKLNFEERKQMKKEKRSQNIPNLDSKKKNFIKRKSSLLTDYVNRESKNLSDIVNGGNIYNHENEIIKNIIELSEKKVLNNQLIMQKEIEDYLTANMEEMYKGLEQLKLSFEEEIKTMEGK
jgi:hypothetical protein